MQKVQPLTWEARILMRSWSLLSNPAEAVHLSRPTIAWYPSGTTSAISILVFTFPPSPRAGRKENTGSQEPHETVHGKGVDHVGRHRRTRHPDSAELYPAGHPPAPEAEHPDDRAHDAHDASRQRPGEAAS